jgi:toxin FitB
MAAVLYVFRTLVADDIPLNAGCLKPLRVMVPEASMLNPNPPASVVGGSLAALLSGIQLLPAGKRRAGLSTALAELMEELFGPRILSFDPPAALAYAPLIARARRAGRPISVADAQIAAIATVHGFQVATRDVVPFVAVGVSVLDPWQAQGA